MLDNLQLVEASEAYYYAREIAPHDPANENHLAVTTLMHDIVEEIKRRGIPLESGIEMPTPRNDFERLYYPHAHQHLTRIIANRKAKITPLESGSQAI